MLLHEIWADEDNKKIVGLPDSKYVSKTEKYELRDFIEAILNEAGKAHTDANKQAVLDAINSFRGSSPMLRSELKAHVLKTVRWPTPASKPK